MSDIIIIGGGIAGLSAAAFLSADTNVTVIEAEPHLGYHSTGRSAAIFIRNYGNATLRALNAVAADFFDRPNEMWDAPILTPRGELLVAREDEMDALVAYEQGSTGLQRLETAEVADLVPILRTDDIVAAIYEPDAQDIDVDRLLQGFASTLRRNGGQVVTKARVIELTRDTGRWIITTANGTFEAPIVINAAGAWGDHIGQMAGLRPLGLQPKRRSAVIMALPDGVSCLNWPVFAPISENWYAKPDAGRLMISPADADPVEAQDIYPDDMVLAEGLDRFERAVTIPVTRPLRSWAGLRSFLPDNTPAVGFDAHADGFFWLIGQGGYGVQTSPALGQFVRDMVVGAHQPWHDTVQTALDPNRIM